MLIYNFQKNKMEKVAMPDWLRDTLSVFGRIAGRILRRIVVGTAMGAAISVLLGKDHHPRIGLPRVNKLPSTSRLLRAKTIRRRKW